MGQYNEPAFKYYDILGGCGESDIEIDDQILKP